MHRPNIIAFGNRRLLSRVICSSNIPRSSCSLSNSTAGNSRHSIRDLVRYFCFRPLRHRQSILSQLTTLRTATTQSRYHLSVCRGICGDTSTCHWQTWRHVAVRREKGVYGSLQFVWRAIRIGSQMFWSNLPSAQLTAWCCGRV